MVTVDGSPRGAKYGVDAPYLLPVAGVVCLANVVIVAISRSVGPVIGACAALMCVGLGLNASRRGKFLVWTELLNDLHLKGDERILDLGCGRGAVLLATAKRLNKGHAIGGDIWNRFDQSGNSVGSTRQASRTADSQHDGVTISRWDVRCRRLKYRDPQHQRSNRAGSGGRRSGASVRSSVNSIGAIPSCRIRYGRCGHDIRVCISGFADTRMMCCQDQNHRRGPNESRRRRHCQTSALERECFLTKQW